MLQMCFANESNFTAASLLVVSELLKSRRDVAIEIFKFGYGATKGEEEEQKVISIHAKAQKTGKTSDSDSEEEENF